MIIQHWTQGLIMLSQQNKGLGKKLEMSSKEDDCEYYS